MARTSVCHSEPGQTAIESCCARDHFRSSRFPIHASVLYWSDSDSSWLPSARTLSFSFSLCAGCSMALPSPKWCPNYQLIFYPGCYRPAVSKPCGNDHYCLHSVSSTAIGCRGRSSSSASSSLRWLASSAYHWSYSRTARGLRENAGFRTNSCYFARICEGLPAIVAGRCAHAVGRGEIDRGMGRRPGAWHSESCQTCSTHRGSCDLDDGRRDLASFGGRASSTAAWRSCSYHTSATSPFLIWTAIAVISFQ